MSLRRWVETNVQYGRELASSSVEGANSGREEFLGDGQLAPFLGEAAVKAIKIATIGAGLGVLGALPQPRRPTGPQSAGIGRSGRRDRIWRGVHVEDVRLGGQNGEWRFEGSECGAGPALAEKKSYRLCVGGNRLHRRCQPVPKTSCAFPKAVL